MKQRILEISQEANLALLEIDLPKYGEMVVYADIPYQIEVGRRGNAEMTVTLVDDYELDQVNPSNDLYLRLMRNEAIDHRHIKATPEIKE
jgi:hypothetical protein